MTTEQRWKPSTLPSPSKHVVTQALSPEQHLAVERKLRDAAPVTLMHAFEDLKQLELFRDLFDALTYFTASRDSGYVLELSDRAVRASLARRLLNAERCAYGTSDSPLLAVTFMAHFVAPRRVTVLRKDVSRSYSFELRLPRPEPRPEYRAYAEAERLGELEGAIMSIYDDGCSLTGRVRGGSGIREAMQAINTVAGMLLGPDGEWVGAESPQLLALAATCLFKRVCDAGCGEPAVTGSCSRCLATVYCSQECQRAHWPTHKRSCAAPSAEAAECLRAFLDAKRLPAALTQLACLKDVALLSGLALTGRGPQRVARVEAKRTGDGRAPILFSATLVTTEAPTEESRDALTVLLVLPNGAPHQIRYRFHELPVTELPWIFEGMLNGVPSSDFAKSLLSDVPGERFQVLVDPTAGRVRCYPRH
jgi:MYND finger